jgi:hypothetical protein
MRISRPSFDDYDVVGSVMQLLFVANTSNETPNAGVLDPTNSGKRVSPPWHRE